MLISHLQAGLLGHPYRNYAWLDLGQHGVGKFFVLSGYLITSKLLSEETISLKRFYLRRFFRLMPCAWAYLASAAIFSAFAFHRIAGKDTLASLLFFRNYIPENGLNGLTSHFWSLSIEEQFYLAWPLTLGLFRRSALRLAIAAAGACAAFRLFRWSIYDRTDLNVHTQVKIDALLVGCILAFILRQSSVRGWLSRHSVPVIAACVPLFLWSVYRYQRLIPLNESIVIALLIGATSLNASSPISRVLEFRHLKFLGVISYSVYVWQELFLVPQWSLIFPFWIVVGPCLTALTAIASWALVEQPCIRLGRRLESHLLMGKELHYPCISIVATPPES